MSTQDSVTQPDVTAAIHRLAEFVVWHVRTSDLPPDVKAAAAVVAASRRYPERPAEVTYPDGDWRVSLIPDDENQPVLDHYPVAVGAYVENLLGEHGGDAHSVLIQRRY